MDCRLKGLFVISFFLYASIYAIHNFMFQIMKQTGVVDQQKYCLLHLLYAFKFVGVMVFCNLGDRKGTHKYMIAVNIMLNSCAILALYNVRSVESIGLRKIMVVFITILHYIFASGTFPLLDSMVYNYLENKGLDVRKSGMIRMGGAVGNMFVQILCMALQKCFKNMLVAGGQDHRINLINVGCNIFFSVLTAVCCLLFAPDYVLGSNIVVQPKKRWNLQKIFSDLLLLANPYLIFYTLAVLGQGIDRAGISTFLSRFLENKGIDRSYVHFFFFCRCIPEILIYAMSKEVENIFGMNGMFLCSAIISSARSFFYAKYDFKAHSTYSVTLASVIVEISKGFYSSFFNYCSLRIFRSFATDSTLSLAQGLFNGTYNALSYVSFAFLGYFIIDYETNVYSEDKNIVKLFSIVAYISCISIIAPLIVITRNFIIKKKSSTKVL